MKWCGECVGVRHMRGVVRHLPPALLEHVQKVKESNLPRN